jgi:hypothetical protein
MNVVWRNGSGKLSRACMINASLAIRLFSNSFSSNLASLRTLVKLKWPPNLFWNWKNSFSITLNMQILSSLAPFYLALTFPGRVDPTVSAVETGACAV